ncbi:sulfatase family protein [Halalkalicoccus salilacus]|uniref:sulfatase family protein n=1 Tax=Halalkalicoccus sp. GCM10025704 TaxID=3252662 RepID=UPI00361B1F68
MWSLPSVASILSGTYPSHHGTGLHNEVLPSEIRTVPERFSKAGFHTVGLSTNPWFSADTGLNRGFDEFDSFSIRSLLSEAGPMKILSFLKNLQAYSAGFSTTKRKHSPDFLFNEVVKQRLSELATSDQPFFLCAHYHGVHHPYYPSPTFRDRFSDLLPLSADDAADIAFQRTEDPYQEIAASCPYSEEEWGAIRNMYDALLFQIDSLLYRLIAHIDDLGIDDETIIVITSDHGDLLGEYDLLSHKLVLHDALISVPLVVRGSKSFPERDDQLIQHIDVLQTLMQELNIPTDGMHGVNLSEESREFTISQRGQQTMQKTLDRVHEFNPAFNHDYVYSGLTTALRTRDWKYIQGDEEAALYELPNEETNLLDVYPDRADEFNTRLAEWMQEYGQPLYSDKRSKFSSTVQDRLADLGYVE